MAHTSRAKDFLEYDNPYNVGMTGIIGNEAGYQAILDCDTLLLLGADFAWRQFYPDTANIIQIDADPTHLGPPASGDARGGGRYQADAGSAAAAPAGSRTTARFLRPTIVERHRK